MNLLCLRCFHQLDPGDFIIEESASTAQLVEPPLSEWEVMGSYQGHIILVDFWLTVKAVTLIFISGRCSAISSAKQG